MHFRKRRVHHQNKSYCNGNVRGACGKAIPKGCDPGKYRSQGHAEPHCEENPQGEKPIQKRQFFHFFFHGNCRLRHHFKTNHAPIPRERTPRPFPIQRSQGENRGDCAKFTTPAENVPASTITAPCPTA